MLKLAVEQNREFQKSIKWANNSSTGEVVSLIKLEIKKLSKYGLNEINEMINKLSNGIVEMSERSGYSAISDVTTYKCGH